MLSVIALVALALSATSFARLCHDPGHLRSTYDYVIVGGGTAGNVLAARLSEDGKNSVLVLEAGGSNEGALVLEVPFLGPTATPNTLFDWNYTVTPQANLDGRTFPYPRGRVLGGSSSVNYMVHHYGSSEDWDRLARLTGESSWSWNSIKRYIARHERFVPPADNHNTTGQYIPSLHSTAGVLPKSLPGWSNGIDQRIVATTAELASEFPFNEDITSGNVLGITWLQCAIGGGQRSSSANTYLKDVMGRKNLDVLINATVTKLVHTGMSGGKPCFKAVQFANGPQGASTIVHATKEVILSAGAIGTPQILQLSGIGDRAELSSNSIETILNLPSVGKNLSEHTLVPNSWLVKGSESLDNLHRDPAAASAALSEWQANKTGPFTDIGTNMFGFLRLPANASIFETMPDPASGPTAAHWEVLFSNFYASGSAAVPPPDPNGSYITAVAALISPTSRELFSICLPTAMNVIQGGIVKLASNNPFEAPLIDLGLLASEFDRFVLREAIRALKRFFSASPWTDYVISPVGGLAGDADAELDAYVRSIATTVFHPVGTASMSPAHVEWGVVDPHLRLKGAEGVRIVDASVFPFVPNAHTAGPTYLLAERAASLIREY
ncbi:hypothetical protein DFP72DRAFT_1060646 [Ephemerocybe angulata]|uniref:pyranose dehydrogenase (acceptor) n=1 Tax=Ephemerocybe angulata TaxID=980116 RepID=A0A8H6IBD2_9AGAR|nr:hypothetical protein DFP72DRAFT_1060646 [Tulosesus angulatus]